MSNVTLTVNVNPWDITFDTADEAMEFIKSVDNNVCLLEFTQDLYLYARDVLLKEGVDLDQL